VESDWRGVAALRGLPREERLLVPGGREPLLQHVRIGRKLRSDEHARWELLLDGRGLNESARVSELLAGLAEAPETFDEELRQAGERLVRWWFEFLLDPGPGEPGRTSAQALLAQVLDTCPANAAGAVAAAIDRAAAEGCRFELVEPTEADQTLYRSVFCSRPVIESALVHVIENATRPKHRLDPEGPPSRISITSSLGERAIFVVVRNDRTVPDQNAKGTGLARHRAQLELFGGGLSAERLEGGWTWQATLELPLPGAAHRNRNGKSS